MASPVDVSHWRSDMSPQHEIFNYAIDKFTAEQEEVRTAAAFAAGMWRFNMWTVIWLTGVFTGNMAVGNLHHFLPLIVKLVERDQEKRLLSLHALKEVCII